MGGKEYGGLRYAILAKKKEKKENLRIIFTHPQRFCRTPAIAIFL